MAVGDIYRLNVRATCQSQHYINTLALTWLGPTVPDPVPTDFGTVASDFLTIWLSHQKNQVVWDSWTSTQLWGAGMTLDPPKCRRLGGKIFAGAISPTQSGALTLPDLLPPQCALVTTLISGYGGRRRRGRWYAFGFSEDDENAGIWGSTLTGPITTNLTTFINKYKTPGGTSPTWKVGIWSERTASGCIPGPGGKGHVKVDDPHPELAWTDINNFTLRPTVYTQRRRVVGVGT
jgi:hypothetical protein